MIKSRESATDTAAVIVDCGIFYSLMLEAPNVTEDIQKRRELVVTL